MKLTINNIESVLNRKHTQTISMFMLIISIAFLFRSLYLIATFDKVKSEVVDIKKFYMRGYGAIPQYQNIYKYQHSGVVHIFKPDTWGNPAYPPGSVVYLLVDRNTSEAKETYDFNGLWLVTTIFLMFSIFTKFIADQLPNKLQNTPKSKV